MLSFYTVLPAGLDPWFTQLITDMSTRGKNKKVLLGIRTRPMREAENLAGIRVASYRPVTEENLLFSVCI
jgi:hypothetical protein